MCSFFGQIAYGASMVLCLGLTLGSLFSPGWHSDGKDKQTGIVVCKLNDSLSEQQNKEICKKLWDEQPTSVKAVIYLMDIAILVEIFAIFWTFASFCACCCRSHFLHILSVAATITTILLVVAMILFGQTHDIQDYKGNNSKKLNNVSYSFWLGIGATLVAIAASIMGSFTVQLTASSRKK